MGAEASTRCRTLVMLIFYSQEFNVRFARGVAFFFIAFLLTLFAYADVPQFSPFTADLQITTTRNEMGPREISGKVYAGSGHVRLDLSAEQGRQTSVITDFATKTTDILMLQQQMYIEYKPGKGQQARMPGNGSEELHPYDPQNPCGDEPGLVCKKIGVEEISGRTCDHWEVTNKNGKVTNVWIDQKLHFPVKVVSADSTMLLSNIHEGEPDANLFKVPEGFKKIDISGMVAPGMGGDPQQRN